jgi:hypothetical protein
MTNLPGRKDIYQLGRDYSRLGALNFSTTVRAYFFFREAFLQTTAAEGVLTRKDEFRAVENAIADLGKCQRWENFP